MEKTTVLHNTFVIERNYPKPPQEVFAALSDPEKKRRWYPVGEQHDVESFEMEFRPGGMEKTVSRFNDKSLFPGVILMAEAIYQDIVTNRRIVMAQTMSLGGRNISSALITIELLKGEKGTDLILTHQGAFFEGSDGPKIREEGWRTILGKLADALGNA
ncbi:MAG TPA: SRPBCC family protein [Bryobacteraceae bacterium]|nr:SRPBCC family protein [Bryobacteraceae bacterium]